MGSFIQQSLFLVLLSVMLASLTFFIHPEPPGLEEKSPWAMSIIDIQNYESEILWVDTRKETDFHSGHITGAILLDEENWDEGFENFLMEWDGESRIVLYCDSLECGKSANTAKLLRDDYGIEHVYYLIGGWNAWKESQK